MERIIRVMEYNRDNKLWDSFINKFHDYWRNIKDCEFEEIKYRFGQVCKAMWHTFNCHNFAETFRHKIWDELKDERLIKPFEKISAAYDSTHTKAWQVIALNDCRDWSSRRYNELEWGMCECVIDCLKVIKHNDEIVLEAVKETLEILK